MDESAIRPDPPVVSFARGALPPMAALRAFYAVAQLGSIRRAAVALAVDHAAVSRQIRALENLLGQKLITRGTRGTMLSPDGARYHEAIGPALRMIAAATTSCASRADANRLSIWSATDFASRWLAPRFGGFQSLHPDLAVELRPSERSPDFAIDGADVEIFYAEESPDREQPGVRQVELCNPFVFPVATPAYLASRPAIMQARDLLDHALIQETRFTAWHRWFAANGIESTAALAGPKFWDGNLSIQAALQHQGIALATDLLVAEEISAGRLVEVNGTLRPFARQQQGPYLLRAPKDDWDRRPVRLFRKWVATQLDACGPSSG